MEDVPPHRAVSPEVARSPSESSENAQEPAAIVVGGEIATPAFCLLDGVAYGKVYIYITWNMLHNSKCILQSHLILFAW